MLAVFKRALKDRRTLLLIYILTAVAFLWMYVAFFPGFKDQTANLESLMKNYPESFMKAFNFDIKNFTTIEGFLSTEQFSFMWPILVIFMVVGYAGSAFAGEIEKGTVEILLSQPISRVKLFLSRYLTGFFMLLVFTVFSVLSAIPICQAYHISYHPENFITITILGFMFGLAIFSLAMLFSVMFSDKGKVFFVAGGLLVLMYVANLLSAIKENLVDLRYASFFYYYNPPKALVYNEIDHWSYLIFGGIVVISIIISIIWIKKRDVTV